MNLEPTSQTELLTYLGQLGQEDQARVVDFARTLTGAARPRVRGVPGKELAKIAGCIGTDDAMEMMAAIEEGCEQIDANSW
jgi:hypothetical protein